jgi:hypothetical protein
MLRINYSYKQWIVNKINYQYEQRLQEPTHLTVYICTYIWSDSFKHLFNSEHHF